VDAKAHDGQVSGAASTDEHYHTSQDNEMMLAQHAAAAEADAEDDMAADEDGEIL